MEQADTRLTDREKDRLQSLKRDAQFCRRNSRHLGRDSFLYSCNEELVLNEGRVWRMGELPKGFRRMTARQCFLNATHYAQSHEFDELPLYYCEGFAISDIGFATQHAWVVRADGVAFDPTWHRTKYMKDAVYIGVPLRHLYVLRTTARTGLYGIMGDGNAAARRTLGQLWQNGFPRGAVALPVLRKGIACKQSDNV